MSEVYGRAYVVQAVFTVLKSIPVLSWSGSFVSSLVHASLGSSVKPVSVSPLYVDDRVLLSGSVLDGRILARSVLEGSRLSFRVTFLTKQSLDIILSKLQNLEAKSLRLENVNFEELRLPKDPQGISGDKVLVSIEFLPTIFLYRGWRVLYPSPQRLIYSAASAAAKLTNIDLRKTATKLAKKTELVGTPKIKIEEYSIGKKEGKERIVKTFRGTATYGVYEAKNAEILIALIKLAEKINVGKSRGIGFGQIKLRSFTVIS